MKFYENFKEKKSKETKRKIFADLERFEGIKEDAIRNILKSKLDKDIQRLQIIAKHFNTTGSIDELVKEINQPNQNPQLKKL